MKNYLTMLFLMLSYLTCFSQVSKIDNEVIISKNYITIGYDTSKNIPNWVYEKHTPKSLIGNARRISIFYKEPLLPNCISESIYKKSGYDKGHLAPAANFKFNDVAMYDSFSLANISPQKPKFNRIYWFKLEEKTREIIAYADTTYIISGHITNNYNDTIQNKVYVPSKYFKAIYAIKDNKCICSISFIMLNTNTKQDYVNCKHSIDYLERLLGRDLFLNISNEEYESYIIFK